MNPWTDDELAAQLAERLDALDRFESTAAGELQLLLGTFNELEIEIPTLDSKFATHLGATLNSDAVDSSIPRNSWRQLGQQWSAGWLTVSGWLKGLGNSSQVAALRPLATGAMLLLILGWIVLSQINSKGFQIIGVNKPRLQLNSNDTVSLLVGPPANYLPATTELSVYFYGLDSYMANRMNPDELAGSAGPNLLESSASFNEPDVEAIDSSSRFANLSLSQEARFVLGVEDVRTTQLAVEQVIVEQGGLVSELTADLSSTGLPQADMHLLIPIENFKTTMDQLRSLGNEVLIETQTTRDLTEIVFDLEARLANQELVETEIGELLAAAQERGDNAQTILEIYDDLVSQREMIEATRIEQLTLNEQIQFASIQVQLVGVEVIEVPEAREPAPFWATVIFADAWVSLVTMLQSGAVFLIWMTVYAPLVLLPAGLFAILRRLWRQRKQAGK